MFTSTSILRGALALAGALSAPSLAWASEWEIDPAHSAVQFSVRHMMVSSVHGTFDKVTGTVTMDEANPTRSRLEVKIDANSINTRDAKRDAHLRSADFFDTGKYPELIFKSTKVEKTGKDKLRVSGDLTMHGVTKPVVLQVNGPSPEIKSPYGFMVRGVSASGKLEGLALAHRCSGDFQAIGRRKGRVDARPETPPQVPLQAHQRPGRPQIEDLAAGRWPSSPRSTSRQTKSGSTRQRSIQWAAHRFDGIP
jgi:polyisoprenoid-binding protein YceI